MPRLPSFGFAAARRLEAHSSMKTTIRQRVIFRTSPARVFEAIIDERRHEAFTGARAKISRRVGGAFSCYGGYIKGINLDLVRAKRIVQAWRSRDWPLGTFSIVTFALSRRATGGTVLSFTHLGVPASDFRAKDSGWRSHYWKPLKAYLEK